MAQATSHVERFGARLILLLSHVPDERLTWAPSSTAKSSLRVVAHCAATNALFAKIITGTMPVIMPTPGEFFDGLDAAAEEITSREEAVARLKRTTAELVAALGTVNAGNVDSAPESPFGPIPMRFWMAEGGNHMAGHAGQIEYLQTIWGDLDKYLG